MFKRVAAICALSIVFTEAAVAQPQVLTSIKPLQLIAADLMDGVAVPELLIPANVSPHHFTLRPSDIRKMTDSGLVLWVGPQMETYISDFLGELDGKIIVVEVAAQNGVVLHQPGAELASETEPQADDRYDPHLWLNTSNARLVAQQLALQLISLDPENQLRYRANLTRFVASIDALEEATMADMVLLKEGPTPSTMTACSISNGSLVSNISLCSCRTMKFNQESGIFSTSDRGWTSCALPACWRM